MEILLQLLVNGLIAGSIYAVLALGFSLVYNTSKFFHMGHGAVAVSASYGAYYLLNWLNVAFWVSFICAVVAAGVISLLAEQFIFRKLRAQKAPPMGMLIASLGFATALQALFAICSGSQFVNLSNYFPYSGTIIIGSAILTYTHFFIIGIAILVFIIVSIVLKKTLFGKLIRALSDDEEMSKIAGINTQKLLYASFFIAGILAGIAGLMHSFDTGMDPLTGLRLLLKGVVGAVIGGLNNIQAAFLGAFILGIVENLAIWKISGEWKDVVAFTILVLFLIFKPQGLMKA